VSDCGDVHLERRLSLLAGFMEERLRLKVREQLGATYAPAASLVVHEGFPTFSYLVAYVEVPIPDVKKVAKVIDREAKELCRHPLGVEEFQRVHQPMVRAREDDRRTNGYWCNSVLHDAQQRPDRIDAARDRSADFAAITPGEMQALAKRYFDPDSCFRFLAGPPVTANR